MQRTLPALVLLAAAAVAMAPRPVDAGGLVEAGELEHARMNALAGGPVSERDAELLERYGCLSGTNSPACHQRGYGNYRYYKHRGTKHRHHRR